MEGVWETRHAGLVFDYPCLCRFGKETGYTIGLVIFGFVFWTMLGFGASEPVDSDDDEDEME